METLQLFIAKGSHDFKLGRHLTKPIQNAVLIDKAYVLLKTSGGLVLIFYSGKSRNNLEGTIYTVKVKYVQEVIDTFSSPLSLVEVKVKNNKFTKALMLVAQPFTELRVDK